MVYAQPRSRPGGGDTQSSLGFLDTNGSPNLASPQDLVTINKKKENLSNIGLCRPQSKNKRKQKKKKKKKKKYLGLKRERTIEYEIDGNTNSDWCTLNNLQRICRGTGKL